MNSYRKNIIAALAFGSMLAFGPALLAQDSSTTNTPPPATSGGQMHGQNVDRMIQRFATQLNLTTDEQTQMKPILVSQMQQINTVRQDSTLTPEDARAKIKAIRQATATQLQAILTPNQFTQYQQMMQRRRPGGMGGAVGTNAPATTPPATPPQH